MSYFVIFTDKLHAKTYEFTSAGVKGHRFEKKTHESHSHAHDAHHQHDEQNKFFKEVAANLQSATEILIIGPGVGKNQFAHYLETHHAHDIFPKVVGVEAVEELDDNKVIAYARKYFTVHHEFWNV
jgi:stalled ribosome rescue protein Dom34